MRKNQLIDIIEDITVMPWLYPQSTGWTYRIFTDNRTNNIIILNNKVTINNITYRPFGKSAANVIDYLDNIYNKSLVTINIANADSITVTNQSNHKTAVFDGNKLKRFNRCSGFHSIAPGFSIMMLIHMYSMYSTYNIKMALLKNCLL